MIYYIYAQLLFIALIITVHASMNGDICMISLALTTILLILIQFILDYRKCSQYLLIFIITILSSELSIQYGGQYILVYSVGFSLPLLKYLFECKLQVLIHIYFIYLALRIIFIQTDYFNMLGILILQPMIHLLILKYSRDEYEQLQEINENIQEKQNFLVNNLLQYNMMQSIFHNFPQGTLVLDQQLNYINSNKKVQKYFNTEAPEQLLELIDQSLLDVKQCDATKFLNEPYFLQLMSKSSWVRDCSELKIQTSLTTKTYENIRTIIDTMATSLKNCDKMENKKICLIKIVKDNKYIYLRVKVFNLKSEGIFIHLLTFENIKKMEEFILLADKNKFQQALLNSLCHELRTPMNCIPQILSEEQIENFLRPALVATKRLVFLINDILDYGEIVSNNLILNVNHFFSEDMYLSLLEIFSQECKIKNITIEFNQENISLITDRERLLRILINLIDNSIKFCPQNGVVKLSFKLKKRDEILVQVEDNGQGMTNEIIDKIYSENYIQDRGKNKTYKLGLGLRICKLLTKQLYENCDFQIESKLGEGTNISFVIIQIKQEQSPKKSGPILNFKRKKCDCVNILIVDDVAFNHFALNQYLRSFNLKSESAFDGQQAIIMVNKKLQSDCCKNYTLVFMDIEMPGINGYSTSQYISSLYKSNNIQCLIVMCSAYTSEKDVEKAKEFGMQKILPKPIDKEQLQKIINKYYL